MYKIRDILEEAYQVNFYSKEYLPVVNGLVDDSLISSRKKTVLSFGMNYLREDFVEVTKSYPKNDQIEVDFGLDFVVLKGDEYRRLIKLLDKYE